MGSRRGDFGDRQLTLATQGEKARGGSSRSQRRVWSQKAKTVEKATLPRLPVPIQPKKRHKLQQERRVVLPKKMRRKAKLMKAKRKKRHLSAPRRRRSNSCVKLPKGDRPKRKNNMKSVRMPS